MKSGENNMLPPGYEEVITKSKVDDHEHKVLKEKNTVVTRADFWKIHHTSAQQDICLKIGRYIKVKKGNFESEVPEVGDPKSVLTLDNEEFLELISFLAEKYEPFKLGLKTYISLDESFTDDGVSYLKEIFNHSDKIKVLQLIFKNKVLPDDLIASISHIKKRQAVKRFEEMLDQDLLEKEWQNWFIQNDWVLGSEFVKILDEREIDTKNIADYLMQAYDGFLDIVEIKRPEGSLKFWADSQDHGNYYPSVDLTKAITQASMYIYEVEQEADSIKFQERIGNVKVIKPRCVLVFGRSNDWDKEKMEAYRILNCGYHNLTILTYDHVLARAKRMLDIND